MQLKKPSWYVDVAAYCVTTFYCFQNLRLLQMDIMSTKNTRSSFWVIDLLSMENEGSVAGLHFSSMVGL
jgi:hypothetical protein